MLFHIVNLGCKVNRVESDAVAATLIARDWRDAPLEAADLVVINTCTVTGEADKKTRKAVRHALAANELAPIVVTGCAAAMTPELYASLDTRVRVVPKAALCLDVDAIARNLDGTAPAEDRIHPGLRVGGNFHTRVGVKVQDGCNHACTYCIVHVARGRSTSKEAQQVIDECVELAAAGVREIVLTGINIGAYCGTIDGRDIRLPGLLAILLERTAEASPAGGELPRFRIGSIEPCDVDNDLIDLMSKAEGRIARHLHLPLQSGCTRVLREMARPYTAEEFAALVEKLRSRVPGIALSTDIIVGFPGESEEDFAETVRLAEKARFMKIHVFPYSRRDGTPAAERPDQVPPEVKSARAARLRQVSDELAAVDLASRAGTTELALVERAGTATLESYHEVQVDPSLAIGSLVPVSL